MVNINLLPWRQLWRKYQLKTVRKIVVLTILVSVIIVVIAHILLLPKIRSLTTQVVALRQQREFETIPLRNDQSKNLVAIDLQKYFIERTAIKEFFSNLAHPTHTEVCFTKIVRQQNTLALLGNTSSAIDMTHFLNQWAAASAFTEVKLEQLQQVNQVYAFRLQAFLNLPGQVPPGAPSVPR